MPKVSVIIPVYGVEKYIERCSRSLFEQTLKDIEFIFVDDCTNDNSIEILRDILELYPNRKPQTTIIQHEVNKGLPAARETGLLQAKGDFIAHCDSDDWVNPEMYQCMYNKAIQDGSDLVVCDIYNHNGHSGDIFKSCYSIKKKTFLKDMMMMKTSWSLCNKLFKNDCYYHHLTPSGYMGEDMALTAQLMEKVNIISYIPKPYYYYFFNNDTTSRSLSKEKILEKFQQIQSNANLVIDQYNNDKSEHKKQIIAIKWAVKKNLWKLVFIPDIRDIWFNTYKEINIRLLLSNYISATDKVKYIFTLMKLYPKNQDRILD